jgi:hypothetical protein
MSGDNGSIRAKLIAAGVQNLIAYGYVLATADNILTDEVYSAFFRAMLDSNKGHGRDIDREIDVLLAELERTNDH